VSHGIREEKKDGSRGTRIRPIRISKNLGESEKKKKRREKRRTIRILKGGGCPGFSFSYYFRYRALKKAGSRGGGEKGKKKVSQRSLLWLRKREMTSEILFLAILIEGEVDEERGEEKGDKGKGRAGNCFSLSGDKTL